MSKDHERHVRARLASLPVVHAEAFQLMVYREVDGPGEVPIWNSRDGVTPFCAIIDGKEYRHAMNAYRPRHTAALPLVAQYVFVTYDRLAWEAMERRKFDRFASDPSDGPGGGKAFLARYPKVEDWLAASPFEHGQPRMISREEYLASTPEWMGKPDAGKEAP